MMQSEIVKQFELQFPLLFEHTEMWFPNGKNSIRVRQIDKTELAFSYTGPSLWSLETIDSFINRMMEGVR